MPADGRWDVTRRLKDNCYVRRCNWIGRTLRRDCPIKHINEGKIEERLEVKGI